MQGAFAGPVFAPGSSEVAVGFLVFLYLVVHNLPQVHMHTVVFSPLWFLCVLLLQERCVRAPALQQRVPSPRSQPVSDLQPTHAGHINPRDLEVFSVNSA